jgi:hypothetical protein
MGQALVERKLEIMIVIKLRIFFLILDTGRKNKEGQISIARAGPCQLSVNPNR